MFEILKFLLSSLIGAMLAPYFSHFLNKEKNEREKILKYLEEAYLLASKIESYSNQLVNHVLFCIAALKNQIKFDQIPKIEEEPFSRLYVLFDFHLSISEELKKKTDELHQEMIAAWKPFFEAINNKEVEENLRRTIDSFLKLSLKGRPLQEEIIKWIKFKKEEIDSKPTFFERKFWGKKVCQVRDFFKGYAT